MRLLGDIDIGEWNITFQILSADKVIYEQALGLEWTPPQEILLKKEDLPSYRDVMHAIEEGIIYKLVSL